MKKGEEVMQVNSIFHQIKEYIRCNPSCLSKLFPQGKQKGAEYYFDEPSYNSHSYNIHKRIVKDFRTDEYQDIISVYQKLNNLSKPIKAVKEMAKQLGISFEYNQYKGGRNG